MDTVLSISGYSTASRPVQRGKGRVEGGKSNMNLTAFFFYGFFRKMSSSVNSNSTAKEKEAGKGV
jgi:hypothetical protein